KRCCDQPPAALRPCTGLLPVLESTSRGGEPENTPAAYPPRRTSRTPTVRSAAACAASASAAARTAPGTPAGSGGNGGWHSAVAPSAAANVTANVTATPDSPVVTG